MRKEELNRCKVFLNASLSYLAMQMFNAKIKEIIEEEGLICISPQEILPPNREIDSVYIFKKNLELIKESDIILSILDSPGEGVIFELGVAYAMGKPILAFRSDKHSYLGKIIEGFWSILPNSNKATNLEELRMKLKTLCMRIRGLK